MNVNLNRQDDIFRLNRILNVINKIGWIGQQYQIEDYKGTLYVRTIFELKSETKKMFICEWVNQNELSENVIFELL